MPRHNNFTNLEMRDMLCVYVQENYSCLAAARRYREMYRNRVQPNRQTFSNIFRRLGETGQFDNLSLCFFEHRSIMVRFTGQELLVFLPFVFNVLFDLFVPPIGFIIFFYVPVSYCFFGRFPHTLLDIFIVFCNVIKLLYLEFLVESFLIQLFGTFVIKAL